MKYILLPLKCIQNEWRNQRKFTWRKGEQCGLAEGQSRDQQQKFQESPGWGELLCGNNQLLVAPMTAEEPSCSQLLYHGALRNIMRDQSCFIDIWHMLYLHLKAHRSYTLWPVGLLVRVILCAKGLSTQRAEDLLSLNECQWQCYQQRQWQHSSVLTTKAVFWPALTFAHTRKRCHPLPLPPTPFGTHTPRCPSPPATKQWQLVQTPRGSPGQHRHAAHRWGTSWLVLQAVCTKARGDFQ